MISLGKNRVDLIDCDRVTKFDILFTNVFNYYLIGNVYLDVLEDKPTVIYSYVFDDNTLDYLTIRDVSFCRVNYPYGLFLVDPKNSFPCFYQNLKLLNLYNSCNNGTHFYSYYKNSLILYDEKMSVVPPKSLINYFDDSIKYGTFIDCFNDSCLYLLSTNSLSGLNKLILFKQDDITNNLTEDLPGGICYIIDYKKDLDTNTGELYLMFVKGTDIDIKSYIISDKSITENINYNHTSSIPITNLSYFSTVESNSTTYVTYFATSSIKPNYTTKSIDQKYEGICRNSDNSYTSLLFEDGRFNKKSLYIDGNRSLILSLKNINENNVSISFWVYPKSTSGVLFNAGKIKISTSYVSFNDSIKNISIPLNKWNHIIITNTGKCYINGYLVFDDLPLYDFSSIDTFWCLGGLVNDDKISYSNYCNAYFDNFRVYSKELSDNDVSILFKEIRCSTIVDPLYSGSSFITLFNFEDIFSSYKEIEVYMLTIQPENYNISITQLPTDKIIFNNVNNNTDQIIIQIDESSLQKISVFDLSSNILYIANLVKESELFELKSKQIINDITNIIVFPVVYDELTGTNRRISVLYTTNNTIIPIIYSSDDNYYYKSNEIILEYNDVTYLFALKQNILEILRYNNSLKRYYFIQKTIFSEIIKRYNFTNNTIGIYTFNYTENKLKTIPITYKGINVEFIDSQSNILNTTTNKDVTFKLINEENTLNHSIEYHL